MARKKHCPRKNRVGDGTRGKYKHSKGPKQPGQWVDFIRKNESFEEYYKAQQIVPEEEFPLFVSTIQQELPSTFRITGTRSHAQKLLEAIQKFFLGKLENVKSDGETVDPPKPIEWYPDNLAWQVNFTKKFIRKSSCMSRFHSFLVTETESGNISRQEAVSMIPALLLDVKPGLKIFDACAAPGSKTVQLIELLHNDETTGVPDGLVVANELQNKRCYMLVHQSKRLNSPCCVITNHDAAAFPTLFIKQDDGEKKPLKFDRILCDVPCSGDGTLRKNPQIWKKWTPQLGTSLFRIQLRILARAVEMLTTGGRIVYSTCTLNPVEDEAVISTLLQKAEGALELVDVSSCLPNLKRSPGLTTWKLMTKDMKVVDHCDPQSEFYSKGFKPDMLAPPEDVAKNLHLERCIRIYPHQQDTGGFFIAVLEKKHPANWENEKRYSDNPNLLPWQSEPDYQLKHNEKIRKRKAAETTSDGGNETSEFEANQVEVRTDVGVESESNLIETVDCQTEGAPTTERTSNKEEKAMELDSSNTHCNVDHVDDDNDNKDEEEDKSGMETSNAEQVHKHCLEDVEGHEENNELNELHETGETSECVADEEFDDRAKQSCSKDNDGCSEGNAVDSASQEENIGQPPRKKAKVDRGYKEDPFVFLKEGDQDWCHISRFYGIDDSFPATQLLVRSEDSKKRNIYLVSKAVRDVMEMVDDRIKVVNTGMKVIARAEADGVGCCFRLMQEGIEVLLPFIRKRKVSIPQKDAMILLTSDRPFFNELASSTREQLDKIEGTGCIVYLYEPNGPHSTPADTIGCKMVFCGWKARVSTRLQISKYHRFHYLTLCGIPPGEKVKDLGNEKQSRAGAEGDDKVKEGEPETAEEELRGFVGDILNVNAPEGALDVGFI